ncbi:MAG: septum formation initiator family protein [Proteobacteria bacterium]|nr:septum formation initiator family protein [Pseudomonadota bacterium]
MIPRKQIQSPRAFRLVLNVNWTLIAILLVMGMFGKRGWLDLKRMNNENQRIQNELSKVQEQKDVLVSEIRALQQDRQAQEHTIRKVLGYIKPDETVIEF